MKPAKIEITEQHARPCLDLPAQVKLYAPGSIDNNNNADLAVIEPPAGRQATVNEPDLTEQFGRQLDQNQPLGRFAPVLPRPGK